MIQSMNIPLRNYILKSSKNINICNINRRKFHDSVPPRSRSSFTRSLTTLAFGGGIAALLTFASDEELKEIQEYFTTAKSTVTNFGAELGLLQETSKKVAAIPLPEPQIPNYRCEQAAVTSSALCSDGLFLTIHLSKDSDVRHCAANVAKVVLETTGCEVAVGFSNSVWSTLSTDVPAGLIKSKEMNQKVRKVKTKNGYSSIPATGGDIFVSAKASNRSTCVKVARAVLDTLPVEAIKDAEDVYGYQGTDFSVWPRPRHDRRTLYQRAINPNTGGTYALAQLWRHHVLDFESLPIEDQNSVIGKRRDGQYLGTVDIQNSPAQFESALDSGLPESSHSACVFGIDENGSPLQVVRHEMACGSLAPGPVTRDNIHESGSYFVGYAKDPEVLSYMLDRMTRQLPQNKHRQSYDSLLDYVSCIRSQVYYVPSIEQLVALTQLPSQSQ